MKRIDAVGTDGCKVTVASYSAPIPAPKLDNSVSLMRAIVRELAESDPDCGPAIGLYCRFCWRHAGAHLDTCLWLRARKMAGLT